MNRDGYLKLNITNNQFSGNAIKSLLYKYIVNCTGVSGNVSKNLF